MAPPGDAGATGATLRHCSHPDYDVTEAALRNLTPLNVSCERSLALATLVNGKITRTESSYQELLLVVKKHRKMFTLTTKEDLKKLL